MKKPRKNSGLLAFLVRAHPIKLKPAEGQGEGHTAASRQRHQPLPGTAYADDLYNIINGVMSR